MKTEPIILKKDKPKGEDKRIFVGCTTEAIAKINTLAQAKKHEIMLFGIVENYETETARIYVITEILIPPQDSNSTGFVTTNDEEYSKWLLKIPREKRKKLKMHFHTHPNMSPTPSGVDIATIKDKIENIDDFYIRIISNADLSFYVQFFDIPNRISYKEMNLYVFNTEESEKGISYNLMNGNQLYFNLDGPNYNCVYKNEELLKELDSKILDKEDKKAIITPPRFPKDTTEERKILIDSLFRVFTATEEDILFNLTKKVEKNPTLRNYQITKEERETLEEYAGMEVKYSDYVIESLEYILYTMFDDSEEDMLHEMLMYDRHKHKGGYPRE